MPQSWEFYQQPYTGAAFPFWWIVGLCNAGPYTNLDVTFLLPNSIYAVPLDQMRVTTVEGLTINLVSQDTSPGAAIRLGIYQNSSSSNNVPDTLVLDSGSDIIIDTTANLGILGYSSLDQVLSADVRYWVVLFTNSLVTNAQIAAVPAGSSIPWGVFQNPSPGGGFGFSIARQIVLPNQPFGSLPDPFPTADLSIANLAANLPVPAIALAFSSVDSSSSSSSSSSGGGSSSSSSSGSSSSSSGSSASSSSSNGGGPKSMVQYDQVGYDPDDFFGTATLAWTQPTTAGNTLIFALSCDVTDASQITPPAGATYITTLTGFGTMYLYYMLAASSQTTTSFQCPSPYTIFYLQGIEISGVMYGLDQQQSQISITEQFSSTSTGTTGMPAAANEMAISFIISGNDDWTPDSPVLAATGSDGIFGSMWGAYWPMGSPAGVACDGTLSSADHYR